MQQNNSTQHYQEMLVRCVHMQRRLSLKYTETVSNITKNTLAERLKELKQRRTYLEEQLNHVR